MKKFSLSSVFIFLLVLLSSCGTSETPDIKTEVDSTISSGSKTGLDASGNIVPFGTPGVISTQIPEGVVMIKKEYTLSNGTKELLQWAVSVDSEGTITSVQIFNPTGSIAEFSKKIGAVTIGKKFIGLKIDTIPEAPETTLAFNEFLAENSK